MVFPDGAPPKDTVTAACPTPQTVSPNRSHRMRSSTSLPLPISNDRYRTRRASRTAASATAAVTYSACRAAVFRRRSPCLSSSCGSSACRRRHTSTGRMPHRAASASSISGITQRLTPRWRSFRHMKRRRSRSKIPDSGNTAAMNHTPSIRRCATAAGVPNVT